MNTDEIIDYLRQVIRSDEGLNNVITQIMNIITLRANNTVNDNVNELREYLHLFRIFNDEQNEALRELGFFIEDEGLEMLHARSHHSFSISLEILNMAELTYSKLLLLKVLELISLAISEYYNKVIRVITNPQ